MKPLRQQLVDYLSVRREFGYALTNAGRWLGHFVDYCEAQRDCSPTATDAPRPTCIRLRRRGP